MKIGRRSKAAIFEITLFFLTIYITYYSLTGKNGLFELLELNQRLRQSEQQNIELKKIISQSRLEKVGLEERTIDLDLLEGEAKKHLGYSSLGEVVSID